MTRHVGNWEEPPNLPPGHDWAGVAGDVQDCYFCGDQLTKGDLFQYNRELIHCREGHEPDPEWRIAATVLPMCGPCRESNIEDPNLAEVNPMVRVGERFGWYVLLPLFLLTALVVFLAALR